MRNESIVLPGVETYTSGSNVAYTVRPRMYHTVAVANGNVKGNFKTPNPFKFKITDQVINGAMREIRNRGYNSQRWEGAVTQILGRLDGDAFPFPFPRLGFDGATVLRDRALAKIYDQMRGNSNLATDIAESGQTIHMLREALKVQKGFVSIVDLLVSKFGDSEKRKNRRSRSVNGRRYRKVHGVWTPESSTGLTMGQVRLDWVTGKWLEARYGWMPLVHSLYDAYDNLMRTQVAEEREMVARSTSSRKTSTVVWDTLGSYASHPVTVTEEMFERMRVAYRFKLPSSGIWDWTSLNPVAIAWELVPLSFVADWFFTIGQSLDNLENYWLWKSSFLGGYETYTYRVEQHRAVRHEWRASGSVAYGQRELDSVMYDGHLRSRYLDRKIVSSLPFPGRPRFKVHLGAKQMLDSAALLHQFIGKRFR